MSKLVFDHIAGWEKTLPDERLDTEFTDDAHLVRGTEDVPTWTENAPVIGEIVIHTLDELKSRRLQEVVYKLAKLTLEKCFVDDDGNSRPWLYPQLVDISRRWIDQCLILKDDAFPQLLLLDEIAPDAVDRIYGAIVSSSAGETTLEPILRPHEPIGSTRYVDFDTTRPVWETDPAKSHISHVVADTDSWEQKMAQALESMDEVLAYARNDHLGLTVPYTIDGEEKRYTPDFLVRIDDGRGAEDPLDLIIEVTGEKRKEKRAKVAAARTLWVPAVNNHGGLGRWAFLEIEDPWNAKNAIREALLREAMPA